MAWQTLASVNKNQDPLPIIWRGTDSILASGEVAILSGAGGEGKSYIALELAMAATSWEQPGEALGLSVRTRRFDEEIEKYSPGAGQYGEKSDVILMSYEDTPNRIWQRWEAILQRRNNTQRKITPNETRIFVNANPEPLWASDSEASGGVPNQGPWDELWRNAETCSLIIIDPISAAFVDHDGNQTGPVRALMRELRRKAKEVQCGVLLIAHSTKAARQEHERGPGTVAGSSAWWDASRSVIAVWRHGDHAIMEVIKSNYGQRGWGSKLARGTVHNGTWSGWYCEEMLTEADIKDLPNSG